MIIHGDSIEVLKTLPENSVDAVVCDGPYELGFMSKAWDTTGIVNRPDFWREVLRVMKPGAHLLNFGGTRTYHRMACAVEDAGFEIRDCIFWHYGSGFPKSLNVYKAAAKTSLCCECDVNINDVPNEGLHGLSESLDAENQVSGDEKSDVLAGLCGQDYIKAKEGQVQASAVSVCPVLKGVSSEMAESSQDVLLSMSRQNETIETRDVGAPSINSREHEGPNTSASVWREEPGLEGRSNLQADQGQLHWPEVRPLSETFHLDGANGRVCNGASASNGAASQAITNENRSSSSQGPQHSEQLHNESRTVPEQSGPQTCRGCAKPIIEKGLGTALKPATEPIVLARKPLSESTVAKNVLKHGTGALNIDGSRIAPQAKDDYGRSASNAEGVRKASGDTFKLGLEPDNGDYANTQGRWPANVLFDEEAAALLDLQVGKLAGGGPSSGRGFQDEYVGGKVQVELPIQKIDKGGFPSRFFYVAKASKRERNAGLEGMPLGPPPGSKRSKPAPGASSPLGQPRANHHPTVKPIKLMEYLCKLITPPGGTILDPFAGSGSTLVAAKNLGFKFIGIEREKEYCEIAEKRVANVLNESDDVA